MARLVASLVACLVLLPPGCGEDEQPCQPVCSDGESRCTDMTHTQACVREPDEPCSARWGDEIPCEPGEFCVSDTGHCQACEPSCTGKECGPDGCQGTCPPGCPYPLTCLVETGQCG